MLNYEEQQKLIIVFVLGVILVLIFTIVALVFIWSPEEKQEVKFEVGKLDYKGVQTEDVVKQYADEITAWVLNSDIDSIYSLVGQDYLEYIGYNKQQFYQYIEDKDILGKKIELQQYTTHRLDGYSAVYNLEFKVLNEAYSLSVVIRETSPDNYTIALDKFIDAIKSEHQVSVSSVTLRITEIIRFTNSAQYKFVLTNNYNKSITVNTIAATNPVILASRQGGAKTPSMTTVPPMPILMGHKDTYEYTATFNMDDEYDYYSYNYLVFKSVEFDGISGTSNLEFKLR